MEKQRRWLPVVGGLIAVFAMIGAVCTAAFAVQGISRAAGGGQQAYAAYLAPVVMLDPPAVSSIDKLDNQLLVSAGVLSVVLSEEAAHYPGNAFSVSVPAADVAKEIHDLFGGVSYEDETVQAAEYIFTYQPESRAYEVPAELRFFSWAPQIQQVRRENNQTVVQVGYLPQGSAWGFYAGGNGQPQQPVKTVEYRLVSDSGQDRIDSIHLQTAP